MSLLDEIRYVSDLRDDFVIILTDSTYACYRANVLLWQKEYGEDYECQPGTAINATRETCCVSICSDLVELNLLTGEELRRFVYGYQLWPLKFDGDVVLYRTNSYSYCSYNFETKEDELVEREDVYPEPKPFVAGGVTFNPVVGRELWLTVTQISPTQVDICCLYPITFTELSEEFAVYQAHRSDVMLVNRLIGAYKLISPPKPFDRFGHFILSKSYVTFYKNYPDEVAMYPITQVAVRGELHPTLISVLRQTFIDEFADLVARYVPREYKLDLGFCVV